jgi:hypothetical protein
VAIKMNFGKLWFIKAVYRVFVLLCFFRQGLAMYLCYWRVVSEDPGGEDLSFLHLSNKELDRDYKVVAKFYCNGEESIGTVKERVMVLVRWHRSTDLFV